MNVFVHTEILSGFDFIKGLGEYVGLFETMGVWLHFFFGHVSELVDTQSVRDEPLFELGVVFFKMLYILLEDLFAEGFFSGVDVAFAEGCL